ncbi:MAG: FKBP-type peptidyl-prolyl cis-trans isomerase [Thermosulfidibacteraceae bacterium]
MKIQKNAVVTFDYELRLGSFDGEVIESSAERGIPAVFIYGRGQMMPAIEEALINKEAGDIVNVSVPPEEAYGERNEEAIQKIPRHFIPPDIELRPGLLLAMHTPEGEEIGMQVVDFDDETVTVDFNHPLAGETLYFTIYIRNVREATPEELLEMAREEGSN